MANFFGKVVNDQDDSLKSKGGSGEFGLNSGLVTKIEFNPNAGANNTPAEAVDLAVSINGQEKNLRIFNITGAVKVNNLDVNPGEPGYQEAYETEMNQRMATIIHFIKATGVTQEAIDAAVVASNPQSFKDWAIAVIATAGTKETYSIKPVDIFLEYQWNIGRKKSGESYDKTYPTLPKNMKGGYFLCPKVATDSPWVATTLGDGGLCYKNAAGVVHPLERDASFMKSNKGTQQFKKNSGGSQGFTQAAQAASTPGAAPFGAGASDTKWE